MWVHEFDYFVKYSLLLTSELVKHGNATYYTFNWLLHKIQNTNIFYLNIEKNTC